MGNTNCWSIHCHLSHTLYVPYKNPEEQMFLIGVILMVPCYAVESVSLFGKRISLFNFNGLNQCGSSI
uniref:Uncharacterized protein n=1 Tax=Solanum lycopersicum TaxID=4081 RepID=A0A3Q7I7X7_SOLLC